MEQPHDAQTLAKAKDTVDLFDEQRTAALGRDRSIGRPWASSGLPVIRDD